MEPNPFVQPTQWNANPLANTSNVIDYADSSTDYGSTTQPYGGYSTPTSTISWKNPTSWHNTQLPGSEQIYYGGPTSVPLNAGATQWFAHGSPSNESGIYDPLNPVNNPYVNLYPYDSSTDEYDSSTREYDGMVNGESFIFFNNPTGWTAITGGPQ